MEAIAAIALAGNVAQFIEYSIKAVLTTYELFRNPDEAWREIMELKAVVDSAHQSLQRIHGSRDVSNNGCVSDPVLANLVASCLGISGEIMALLDSLELDHSIAGFIKSVQTKARSLIKRPELKGLCDRLHSIRDQISAHLLVLIQEEQLNLTRNFRLFASSSEAFQQAMDTKLHEVIDYLRLISSSEQQKTPAQSSGPRGLRFRKRNMPEAAKSEQEIWDADSVEMRLLNTPELLRPVLFHRVNTYATKMSELKERTILDTLHFSQVKEREFSIAEAHRNTFQWIFEDDRNKFVTWLRQSNGIYWIAGKAGSGKSTLMRFLTNHPSTRESLKAWAGTKKLITAKHYFWSPGTAIQKSQEGLFRSLLLQILNQHPEVIPDVCTDRWEAPFADAYNPWSRTELIAAFDKLGGLKTRGYRVCLFIDGLDEYDGDHAELVSVIRRMGASDNVKICVSSRQWLEFSDAFEQSGWTLYLQDLTHEDIRSYVYDELNNDSRFNTLQERNNAAAEKLGLMITERAHGVFLWVFLVVRSLLRGLRNEDELSDLQRRLRELPSDLRDYFDRMLVTIEDVYRERTARLFLTMSEAKTTFPVVTFYFMDLGEGTASAEFLQHWPDVDLDEDKVVGTKKRQLIAQCKDLIFITPHPGAAGVLFSERVGFLHRTVGDYLHTADVKSKLLQIAGAGFDANKVLLATNLAQVRSLIHLHNRTYIHPHLRQWILGSLYYAHALEVVSGGGAPTPETVGALDELGAVITTQFARWGFADAMNCFFGRPEIESFLELVCRCDLASYVGEKHPRLTPGQLGRLAPGWGSPLEIRQDSDFELHEREMSKDGESDWRLKCQVKAQVSLPSQQKSPAAEGGSLNEATEPARVQIQDAKVDKGRISSRFGSILRRRLFGSRGRLEGS